MFRQGREQCKFSLERGQQSVRAEHCDRVYRLPVGVDQVELDPIAKLMWASEIEFQTHLRQSFGQADMFQLQIYS